jgi:hypothetical protein
MTFNLNYHYYHVIAHGMKSRWILIIFLFYPHQFPYTFNTHIVIITFLLFFVIKINTGPPNSWSWIFCLSSHMIEMIKTARLECAITLWHKLNTTVNNVQPFYSPSVKSNLKFSGWIPLISLDNMKGKGFIAFWFQIWP